MNFAQFGRCLDVTLSDVGYEYLIIWPCKQDLDPKNIDWNQRWELPASDPFTAQGSGAIVVRPKDDVAHCLRSPLSAAPGAYVTVTPCPAHPPPPELRWSVYRNTGAYDTSYRIRDASGLCLTPTDPDAPQPDLYPLHGYNVTKSVVRPCDDSQEQKWNADPWVLKARPVEYVGER